MTTGAFLMAGIAELSELNAFASSILRASPRTTINRQHCVFFHEGAQRAASRTCSTTLSSMGVVLFADASSCLDCFQNFHGLPLYELVVPVFFPGIFTDQGNKTATSQIDNFIIVFVPDYLIQLLTVTRTDRYHHPSFNR